MCIVSGAIIYLWSSVCFGLVNGMLFLKLFTIIFMKIAGIQGVNSAPITIYAIVVVSIIMIVIVLLSMMQCFRFVQSLQDKIRFISRKRHEKSCLFDFTHKIIMLQCKDLTKNGKERLYRMTNEQSIVKVERLTKRIGSKTLVENISFEVKKAK